MRRNLGNTQPERQLLRPDRVRLDLRPGVLERQLFRVGKVVRRPVGVVVGDTCVRVAGDDDCEEGSVGRRDGGGGNVHEL
jgi:hypothetical protein